MAHDALTIEPIREGFFCLRPANFMWPSSANVYLIMETGIGKGAFSMIDLGCGRPDVVGQLTGALSQLGLTFSGLRRIVFSHAHPDHMGAAEVVFNEVLGANGCTDILIHEHDFESARDPKRLEDVYDIPLARRYYGDGASPASDLLKFFIDFGCPMSRAIPTEIVKDGDYVKLGEYNFEVIHTPGHSPGHISLFDKKEKILFGGDLVGEVVAWYTPTSGGVTGYLSSLDRIERRNPEVILPSHGGIIHDPEKKIADTRERLLFRERKMLEILSEGPHSFVELNSRMFSKEMIHFFPGAGITESHIQKLIRDGKIGRINDEIVLK